MQLCSRLLSAQALPYVGLLIAMIFFIYAVIGMQVSLCYEHRFKFWLLIKQVSDDKQNITITSYRLPPVYKSIIIKSLWF